MAGLLALKAAIIFSYAYFSWIYGERIGNGLGGISRWLAGAWTLLAAQSLWQTVFYYAGFTMGTFTDALALVLAVLSLAPLVIKTHVKESAQTTASVSWTWTAASVIPAILAAAYIIRAAYLGASIDPIRTPWPLLPAPTLVAFGIILACGIISALKNRSVWPATVITALGIVSAVSIAPLVYTNGYGFDGFLHRASMEVLADSGTLNPKPPYYIGSYVLETWLSRLASLPIGWIDRWFMTAVMAMIPLAIVWAVRVNEHAKFALAGLLVFMPITPFVVTTPQAFAYAVGFLAIGTALARMHPIAPTLLAGWSIAIHPLAGLPFFFATFALILRQRWLKWPLVILAGIAVPAAFMALGLVSNNQVTFDAAKLIDTQTLQEIVSRFKPPTNRVALWADAAALLEILQIPLLLLGAGYAIWKNNGHRNEWLTITCAGILLMLSGFVLQTAGDFPFLIDYERGNYSERLFIIARLLLLVPALSGYAIGLGRIPRLGLIHAVLLLILIPAAGAANVYAALPRHDAANVSRGWSVGQWDKEAVRWIDRNAGSAPYTVLANQSVSAAAVEALGFKRYAREVFFYPIPTGGPLYQEFLKAMDPESNVEPVKKAAQLGQSKLVYVVLNDYWWDAKKVAEHLSAMADSEISFGEGRLTVYKFEIN